MDTVDLLWVASVLLVVWFGLVQERKVLKANAEEKNKIIKTFLGENDAP